MHTPSRRTLVITGAVLIALVLLGLAWWSSSLNQKRATIDSEASARGFSSETPSFSAGEGSTRANLVNLFASTFGGNGGAHGSSTAQAARPLLFRISPVPGAPLALTSLLGSNEESVFFVERPTGNLFALPLAGGEAKRLSNTLIPHVYEALWVGNGRVVIRHSNDSGVTLLTLLASLKSATSSEVGTLTGTYLDDAVLSVAARPGGKEPALFYLAHTKDGVIGIVSNSDGTAGKRVWSSPITGWNMAWIGDDRISLSQKAAEGIIGSAYTLSPSKGTLSLVVGNEPGLIAMPHPTKDAVLYSTSQNGETKLFARVGTTTQELPLTTLAEKCVWSPGDSLSVVCAVPTSIPRVALPDAWYRGVVHFSDRLFRVDVADGSSKPLTDPLSESGARLDVFHPSISASGKYLLFTDKNTGTGWVLKL